MASYKLSELLSFSSTSPLFSRRPPTSLIACFPVRMRNCFCVHVSCDSSELKPPFVNPRECVSRQRSKTKESQLSPSQQPPLDSEKKKKKSRRGERKHSFVLLHVRFLRRGSFEGMRARGKKASDVTRVCEMCVRLGFLESPTSGRSKPRVCKRL